MRHNQKQNKPGLAENQLSKIRQALLLSKSKITGITIAENPDSFDFSNRIKSIRVNLGKALKNFK